jgi:hypothetical protein
LPETSPLFCGGYRLMALIVRLYGHLEQVIAGRLC